jgi:hypothetical protein
LITNFQRSQVSSNLPSPKKSEVMGWLSKLRLRLYGSDRQADFEKALRKELEDWNRSAWRDEICGRRERGGGNQYTLSGTLSKVAAAAYRTSEKVYFTGMAQTFPNGDRLEYGKQGKVVGPATGGPSFKVQFPGNKGPLYMWLNQLSRTAPAPLPGNYHSSEKVYFTGKTQTLSNGDRLEYGKQGEVVGPVTAPNFKVGEGLDVQFPGKIRRVGLADLT